MKGKGVWWGVGDSLGVGEGVESGWQSRTATQLGG